MDSILKAKWIAPASEMGEVCPVFRKCFSLEKKVERAVLQVTALGVYVSDINGTRVGNFVLAPGWTAYQKRLQYQAYDVTELLEKENTLSVTVGKGWYRGRLPGWKSTKQEALQKNPAGMLASLEILYVDGSSETIYTDESWNVQESQIRFSEIYDGETCDASFKTTVEGPVSLFEGPTETLIPQQGEEVREQERVSPCRIFTTPAGETVVDFGQEITGYVELSVDAPAGSEILLSHAEVMDQQGNFYTENYRSAKAKLQYFCREGKQVYKPQFTYFGFRYIRVDRFPGGPEAAKPENFTAVAVYSHMKRTGYLRSSNPLLNRLFENVVWGQRGNFLDVPTDCPQRDERLGWTGDAQVFIRTAALNFDVEKFFTKWLADMEADQGEDGFVGHVIPNMIDDPESSAAWADAATICPWEIYLAYGNPSILRNQLSCMKKWLHYIAVHTKEDYLWIGGNHFGDWLGLDAPSGSYKGSSNEDFIASAFYAHSTELVVKAGRVLGEDVSQYEELYSNIVNAFRKRFPVYHTQTECVLAAHFHLAEDCQAAADQLAGLVREAGTQLRTGFVGTPYLLHVLSEYGYTELAYSLLLREKYPSWLYPVTKGATTIWEHWDGIMEDGGFWSSDMNSYNHYAYGAVADWVYCVAAGIQTQEEHPGYEKAVIAPHPDARLGWLEAVVETRHGRIRSRWEREGDVWRYEIETPVESRICIDGREHTVPAGRYLYYSPCC